MADTKEFAYIPSGYLCLILKTAVNNTWTGDDDWSLSVMGHLLFNCNLINIFKFESINYIDFNFIKTDYQWLYVYQLFANAYKVIDELPPMINGSALKIFDEERIVDFPTDKLKTYTKLFLEEFTEIATFPNLENEWLNLFKYLQDNKLTWNELSHPTAKQIIYDAEKHQLFDEFGNLINWYDILSLNVSPQIPVGNFKLHVYQHKSYFITSVKNIDWQCTYLLSGYDDED